MKRFGYLVLLFLLTSSFAITGDGGSGYSIYGIGDLQYFPSVTSAGMGGAGLALSSPFYLDCYNPALWTPINRVRIAFSSLYQGYATSDNRASGYFASARFSGAQLAIPVLGKYGITFSTGVLPYSKLNYHIITPAVYSGSIPFSIHYIGDGGLSQAYLGFSGAVGTDIALGIKLDYYFGTLQNTIQESFTGSGYTTAQVDRLTTMNGIGCTVGFIYSGFHSLFNLPEGHSFNVAAVVSTSANLTAIEERYYTYTTNITSYDTLIGADGKFHLPLRLAAGIVYQADHWSIASDIVTQPWSDATYNDHPVPNIRDSYRWSLGGAIAPASTPAKPVAQRLAYRAGIYYDASYYRIKGIAINEIGLSLGVLVPVFSESRLGFAAQYSLRGTTDEGLQKDRIFRFILTLNIGELWFIKPQEE